MVEVFEGRPTFLSLQLWDTADGGRLNDLHNYLIPAERQNDSRVGIQKILHYYKGDGMHIFHKSV